MTDTVEGGCRCGNIRYQIALSQLPAVYACHCRDCQTWSASAFSMQFVVAEHLFAISGKPGRYEQTSSDGQRISYQRACDICFTRIYNSNSARPGMVVVRAGTLDRSEELTIAAHIWAARKLSGIEIPLGTAAWPQGAPPDELAAILSRG